MKRKTPTKNVNKFLVEVQNQQKRIPIVPSRIVRIAQQTLSLMNVRSAVLSLVFVTDRKIKSLNKTFLNRDHTTDVLAFDLSNDTVSYSGKKRISRLEGEIIISATTAVRNAGRFDSTPYDELILYVVHGVLHLLGYDDHDPKEEKRMQKKQRDIVKRLDI